MCEDKPLWLATEMDTLLTVCYELRAPSSSRVEGVTCGSMGRVYYGMRHYDTCTIPEHTVIVRIGPWAPVSKSSGRSGLQI